MIGKPTKHWESVNIGKRLRELGLEDHFPVEVVSALPAFGTSMCACSVAGLAVVECSEETGHEDQNSN